MRIAKWLWIAVAGARAGRTSSAISLLILAVLIVALTGMLGFSRGALALVEVRTYPDSSVRLFGESTGDWLAATTSGDVNGDGLTEIVVGASLRTNTGSTGTIYVLAQQDMTDTMGISEVAALELTAPGEFVGFSLGAGDLDGDGDDEIVSTAVDHLVVFLGAADLLSRTTGDVRVLDVEPGTWTQALRVAVADLTGDGVADVIYGSPGTRGGTDQVIVLVGPFSDDGPTRLQPTRVVRIAAPAAATLFFGWTLAAGDLTGDGHADLAVNHLSEAGDAVSVFAGPIVVEGAAPLQLDPVVTLASESSNIAALAVGDASLNGVNELLVSTTASLVWSIPQRLLTPLRFPFIEIAGAEVVNGCCEIAFASRLAVADYDGDGLQDLLIGSWGDEPETSGKFNTGSVLGFAGIDRSAGIDGVTPMLRAPGDEVVIWGQGFVNPSVTLMDHSGQEFSVPVREEALGRLTVDVPDLVVSGSVDVAVATDLGEVQLEDAFKVEKSAQSVGLPPGWNLVGWTGLSSVATANVAGNFDALFTFDAAAQEFLRFSPAAPSSLNTLNELHSGDGIWINTLGRGNWTLPLTSGPRSVTLAPGFNLATWTGPDATAVSDAVAELGDGLTAVFTWDAGSQNFQRFSPSLPSPLNTAKTVNFGDGLWIKVNRPLTWEQPGRPAPPVPRKTAVANSVLEAQAAVAFVNQGLATGSGVVVSDRQVLTNAHVVGGAASVILRFMSGEERHGFVTALDGTLDLAVVEVVDLPPSSRRLDWEAAPAPVPTTPVWAWGFPGGETFGIGTSATVSSGIVSALQSEDNLFFIQTDAAINPGNSGGALILEDGRLVGINDFAVLISGQDAEGLNFAIDVSAHRERITALLETTP